jgi:hypothetical protein
MPEESTTPDPVEMTHSFYEAMDRERDFDSLRSFFERWTCRSAASAGV